MLKSNPIPESGNSAAFAIDSLVSVIWPFCGPALEGENAISTVHVSAKPRVVPHVVPAIKNADEIENRRS